MLDHARIEHAKLHDIACQYGMRDEPNDMEDFAFRLVNSVREKLFPIKYALYLWAERN